MGRKPDLRQVDQAAQEAGIPSDERSEFGRYLERCKRHGERGTKNDRGDFTYGELLEKAREFAEGAR